MMMETTPEVEKGKPKYKKKCVFCGTFELMSLKSHMCTKCKIRAYGVKK